MNKCPTCGSTAPERHPAVQFEGEMELCTDVFHLQVTPSNLPKYRDAVMAKREETKP